MLITVREQPERGTRAFDCAPRDYGDGVVCVCNAEYCDKLEDITEQDLSKGNYLLYTSSKAGDRLAKSVNVFEASVIQECLNSNILAQLIARLRVPGLIPGMTKNIIIATAPEEPVFYRLNADVTYQEIMGFGGALTDSTGLNIMSLSDDAREKLL
ncbi:unnamed protein product, partial [Timema podura]|nr:unnamed protein product [Timema podura]